MWVFSSSSSRYEKNKKKPKNEAYKTASSWNELFFSDDDDILCRYTKCTSCQWILRIFASVYVCPFCLVIMLCCLLLCYSPSHHQSFFVLLYCLMVHWLPLCINSIFSPQLSFFFHCSYHITRGVPFPKSSSSRIAS